MCPNNMCPNINMFHAPIIELAGCGAALNTMEHEKILIIIITMTILMDAYWLIAVQLFH